ncbi:MAG: FtsX-like permease family protein [Puniceicoccales bacterium]|nr:FtsX-like permease family protein [Puniceicoccales bacterium]
MASKWWAYHAWRQLFPKNGRCFRVLFSTLGVALAVAVLTVVLAVMGGFYEEICQTLRTVHGDVAVEVRAERGALAKTAVEERLIEAMPGVLEVEPFLTAPILMASRSAHALPLVQARGCGEGLRLGRALATELAVVEGDEVLLMAPDALLQRQGNEVVLPLSVAVTEVLAKGRNGWHDGLAFLSKNELHELVGQDGRAASGYLLRLARPKEAPRLARELNGLLPANFHARSWLESGGELLSMLAMERAALFLSLACIMAMAAFCMAGALAMAVMQKTQEIGLLLAMGCTKGKIALSFFLQGVAIGAGGVLCGLPIAALVLACRDGILRCVLALFGRGEQVFHFYGFRHLPAKIFFHDLAAVAILTFLATALASLLPIRSIFRLNPSTALRHG